MSIRRTLALVHREWLVATRNYYLAVVLLFALLFIVVIRFMIPDEASVEPALYVAVEASERDGLWDALSAYPGESRLQSLQQMASAEEVREAMAGDVHSLGLIVRAPVDGLPNVELVFQGHESEATRRMMRSAIEERLLQSAGVENPVPVVAIEGEGAPRVPFNQHVLPVFLLTEPGLVALFLMAALVFMEKREGTLRAFRVSPGRVAEFVVSKIAVLVVLSLLFTFLVTPLTAGWGPNYLHLAAIVVLSSTFSAATGLVLSAFFEGVAQATLWLMALFTVLTVPIASYLMPTFAPPYIRAMPSYPMIFGMRDALFAGGARADVFLALLAWSAGALAAAVLVYQRRLAVE